MLVFVCHFILLLFRVFFRIYFFYMSYYYNKVTWKGSKSIDCFRKIIPKIVKSRFIGEGRRGFISIASIEVMYFSSHYQFNLFSRHT